MTRFCAIFLVLAALLSFAGCDGTPATTTNPPESTSSSTTISQPPSSTAASVPNTTGTFVPPTTLPVTTAPPATTLPPVTSAPPVTTLPPATSAPHIHIFTAATCTEASKCTVCGQIQGEPLGHQLSAATCTEAAKCTVCGQIQGEPLGHQLSAATCTEPAKCTVCGQTQGELLPHSFADATCTEPAKCVCGETQGEPLGHTFDHGNCSRCGAEDPDYVFPSVSTMAGAWHCSFLADTFNSSSDAMVGKYTLFLADSEPYMSATYGVELSTLDPEFQQILIEDGNATEYEGKLYYFGMGDGSPITVVSEENRQIVLKDEGGTVLTLERTGENTMAVSAVEPVTDPGAYTLLYNFPLGTTLTFAPAA